MSTSALRSMERRLEEKLLKTNARIDSTNQRLETSEEKITHTDQKLASFEEEYANNRDQDLLAFADQYERADFASNLQKGNQVLITGSGIRLQKNY